ncbi:hypothetical protein [Fodinicola feengrottensis]|uniref:hypothetical protein n=1 Tax=Fodinicola feengrottensis TaxID=435914 RepID=UPI0013D32E01|nr:hypothetical protein [Fodinicola feengrottensis]
MDIEPVVVKGARQGSVGALLGGALACLVLGPGAIWQAITNHVDPAHPIGTAHTNYLPPAGRVIMFIIGALLSLLALILLLAAAVQANQRSKVTFTRRWRAIRELRHDRPARLEGRDRDRGRHRRRCGTADFLAQEAPRS